METDHKRSKEETEKITIIMTCYNRRDMTTACIRSLRNNKTGCCFIVVDDGSTDGTRNSLKELQAEGTEISVLGGDGKLFYSGGMRKGIEEAKRQEGTAWYLIVNDDVAFKAGVIDGMAQTEDRYYKDTGEHRVLIGCTLSESGGLSYGGIRYTGRGVKYEICSPEDEGECDTFNANCVLIPHDIFFETENIDSKYIHSLGDFDYGLSMSRRGVKLCTYGEYVGICNDNSTEGTWMDTGLSRRDRLRAKENPKGAPFPQWFYFLRKNFGLRKALLHSVTPYVRIALGK